jgi:hypothetical protein
MPGWGRARWRRRAAVLAICIILVLLVVVLAAQGLVAAANLVTVFSVISVIGALAAWGQARRSSPGRRVSRQTDFGGLLRDIAEAHGKSRTEILSRSKIGSVW